MDPSGAIVARSSYDDKSGAWTVLPPESTTPIASGKVDYNFATAGLGRTPGTILLRQGGTTGRVVELNLTTGAQEDLLPGGSTLIHAPQTGLLIGARVPEENKGLVLYDPVLEKRMASIRRAFKGASITLSSISADLDTVVVFIEDQDLAGTWQLVNFKTGKADPYADKYPDIKAEFIGPTKIYKYKAADGLDLDGVLTLPPGHEAKGLALVVLPHGGPESSDELGFDWWAQAFASRGYAVFQPNFRGSGGRGVQFRNAGFGQWGLKMQTDISDGVAALAAEGIVDPKRACIVGASYGGYAALAGVTVQQGLYRCAASYAGVSDPQAMLYADTESGGATNLESRRYWRSYLGISLNESVPDSITPTKMAAKADAPILLIHGDDDTVVSITQSEAMEAALRRAGKPVEFIKLKGEDHFLSRSQTRLEMLKAMMAFVQQHNPA